VEQEYPVIRSTVVIPARYASTRLPGKPLLDRTGKPLIQHVWENARRARLSSEIYVATDDERIVRAVEAFGGRCILTDPGCPSGTDRVAQATKGLATDVVVNVQGDEPELPPETIDRLIGLFADDELKVATAAAHLNRRADYFNPNVVKVVLDEDGFALYFSRSPIPHKRDGEPSKEELARCYQHVGVYAYRHGFLQDFARHSPAFLETMERLEQLRILAMGERIRVILVDEPSAGIDTPEDYERFVARRLHSANITSDGQTT